MSYLGVAWEFFKRWFLPMPAHDDPRFASVADDDPAQEALAVTSTTPDPDDKDARAFSTATETADMPDTDEPVEQVYGERPVVDPSIAEGIYDAMEDDEYDPAEDRDFATGEPDENRDDISNVAYEDEVSVKSQTASPGEAAADSQQEPAVDSSEQPQNGPIKNVKPLPAGLPEAAEARASRAHSRVNPFSTE